MFIALAIGAVLLAAMCVSSASMKLRRHEQAVAIIGGTVGVPLRFFPVLASLELAGAAGILIGLWLEPLGIAAAAGLVAHFTGAVTGHLRAPATPRTSPCRCRRSRCPSPCLSSGSSPRDAVPAFSADQELTTMSIAVTATSGNLGRLDTDALPFPYPTQFNDHQEDEHEGIRDHRTRQPAGTAGPPAAAASSR